MWRVLQVLSWKKNLEGCRSTSGKLCSLVAWTYLVMSTLSTVSSSGMQGHNHTPDPPKKRQHIWARNFNKRLFLHWNVSRGEVSTTLFWTPLCFHIPGRSATRIVTHKKENETGESLLALSLEPIRNCVLIRPSFKLGQTPRASGHWHWRDGFAVFIGDSF